MNQYLSRDKILSLVPMRRMKPATTRDRGNKGNQPDNLTTISPNYWKL